MTIYTVEISSQWQLRLQEEYQHRIEGDHLILWKMGISILTSVYSYSGEKERQTLLANLRAKAQSKQLQIIEEVNENLVRFGYIQPEEVRPGVMRLALHAFTMAEHSCLQTSIYLDRSEDLETGLLIWRDLQYLEKA
ncbi:MAG: hypothetical protein VB108_07310 [Anaerolineaceae bacterium]|nr:hypothetical protein [Anaerolineaceae bacterium]